jgi:PAS domain S-box-containing protein
MSRPAPRKSVSSISTQLACIVAFVLPSLIASVGHASEQSLFPADCPPPIADVENAHDAVAATHSAMTGTPLDWFTNWGSYMPRTHCLQNEAGQTDWPWVIALFVLTITVITGYLRIFFFWRKSYLQESEADRNRKMMHLAYIFLWCAVCGYGLSLVMYGWPVYRLLAICLLVLNVVTWKFAWNLDDFRVSLSARRLARELEETLRIRTEQLEQQVADRTAELQSKHQALIESEDRFNRMVANVPGMVYQYIETADGQVQMPYISEFVTELFGVTPEDAVADPMLLFACVVEEDRETHRVSIDRSRENLSPWLCEFRVERPDGEVRWLRGQSRPQRRDDGSTMWDGLLIDITDQKVHEAELRELSHVAESANRAKSDFLANMSHEIRTPLGAIIGFSELLLEDLQAQSVDLSETDEATEQRLQWAGTVRGSGKHLLALINDVLDLSKIEAGKMEMELLECRPHRMLGEIISVMRVPAQSKKLDLSLHYLSEMPETIETDPTRFRQVVLNLVNNAVKFTESGQIRILAGIEQTDEGPFLMVHVADTGIGMDDAALSRLFQPFTQADSSVTRRFGGTGLGLCISKYIAENLGGNLSVKSEAGVGSTFTLRIALGDISQAKMIAQGAAEAMTEPFEADLEQDQSVASISERTPTGSLSGKRVLVVDDGQTNRRLISYLLRREGVQVEEAGDGAQAVSILANDFDGFDLVLMDMQMPKLDGYSATRMLRDRGCEVPIFALTAHAMSGDRERCLSAGCDGYLTKPVDREMLMEAVANPRMKYASDRQAGQATKAKDIQSIPDRLESSLPMDDEEFVEIAAEFLDKAQSRLSELVSAADAGDRQTLATVAHWLRGVSGSAGYAAIQIAAERIETLAHAASDADDSSDAIQTAQSQIKSIEQLLVAARRGLPGQPKQTPSDQKSLEQKQNTQAD